MVEFVSLAIFISRSDKHPGALVVLLTAVAGGGLQPMPSWARWTRCPAALGLFALQGKPQPVFWEMPKCKNTWKNLSKLPYDFFSVSPWPWPHWRGGWVRNSPSATGWWGTQPPACAKRREALIWIWAQDSVDANMQGLMDRIGETGLMRWIHDNQLHQTSLILTCKNAGTPFWH